MQVLRVQNSQTSFQALRGFECSKNLEPIIGKASKTLEQRLFNAFNGNEDFNELCRRNDVWVNIEPKYNEFIRSGLEVSIRAKKLNTSDIARKENVISYLAAKLYEGGDYKRIYDYSEISKNSHIYRLVDLIDDFEDRTYEVIKGFIRNYKLKSAITHFFEKSV